MAEPKQLDHYPVLRMARLGDMVVLQPLVGGQVAGHSFTCDLEKGTVQSSEQSAPSSQSTQVYGVLGLLQLDAGPALVVVTGVHQVAQLRGFPVYRVTSTSVLTGSSSRRWGAADRALLALLRHGTSPAAEGHGLYISYGGDLTLTQQRYEDAHQSAAAGGREGKPTSTSSAWQRADPALTWNHALAKPLLEAGLGRFVPPAIAGFVGQLAQVELQPGSSVRITLIARRTWQRAGCRQWRRGAGPAQGGQVANFVESEQLVEAGQACASFVQVRGSIPLLWSQTPDLRYKIPIRIAPPSQQEAVCGGHVDRLVQAYGACTAINLANQTGREGKLSAAYSAAAAAYARDQPGAPFRLVPFDFHRQCGATNYGRLSLLWSELLPDFRRFGYWFRDGVGAASRQAGVFRTNCIDTLDRTNVVQGMLGRKALEAVLVRLGLMQEGSSLAELSPAAEASFRVLWADHGDDISRQYAGTGAMKSSFTRTGKRDIWGLLDDGSKSLTRYYLNNFQDGRKQDAIDLVTGNYRASVSGKPLPAAAQGSPSLPLLAALTLLALALRTAWQLAAGSSGGNGTTLALAQQAVLLLAAAAGILVLMQRYGKHLVDAPRLRPDLAHPWAH